MLFYQKDKNTDITDTKTGNILHCLPPFFSLRSSTWEKWGREAEKGGRWQITEHGSEVQPRAGVGDDAEEERTCCQLHSLGQNQLGLSRAAPGKAQHPSG